MKYLTAVLPVLLFAACGATIGCPLFADSFEQDAEPLDDLCLLSDSFDDPSTRASWQRLFELEGWPGDQLELWDIGGAAAGQMTLMPHSSAWFQDLRGVLVFKMVIGDFVVDTRFTATRRTGSGAPQTQYSLAGLFIRVPREITVPGDWTSGGENYVFLSAGAADVPGSYQYEVKTTIDSDSVLQIASACEPVCSGMQSFELRVARIEGTHMIMLRRPPGGQWQVHQRYWRADFPAALQVGVTAYTDWSSIEGPYWPDNQFGHNNTVITDGNPDLMARFEHVNFQRPAVPAVLQGRDFSAAFDPTDPTTVSDAELLSFLAY